MQEKGFNTKNPSIADFQPMVGVFTAPFTKVLKRKKPSSISEGCLYLISKGI
jgi:hypothetical protein